MVLRGWIVLFVVGLSSIRAAELFDVPVRINMGGPEVVDSFGRVWLGDRIDCAAPEASDPLNIRPNDGGGGQAICDWAAAQFIDGGAEQLDELGFDGTDAGDITLVSTIRWDVGADGTNFDVALPVPNGEYTVNLYFIEACCPERHFKISIQDELLFDDVSFLEYADPPGLGKPGRLTFEDISVDDELLRISFLPCPECPDVLDINALVAAIDVVSSPECDHLGMDLGAHVDAAEGVAGRELEWRARCDSL